ncbi:hypothetical protein H8E06_01135 [bacterium]|nr:hypothetical protein [bacterium]
MEKELLTKVLDKIVVEYVTTVKPAVIADDEIIPPVESVRYIRAPKDSSQTDEPLRIVAYDLLREKDVELDMNDEFYIRACFNGLLPNTTTINDFATDEHPDPTKYNQQYIDKLDEYKYRVNTVLRVAKNEWESLHVYDLIEIAQSEYNYDAEPFVDDDDCKEKIIGILEEKFIEHAQKGRASMVEFKLKESRNVIEKLGADPSDIDSVRSKWLDVIRRYRDDALTALDEEEEIAKADNDEQGIEEIEVIKNMLRDLPKEIKHLEHLNSPNDVVDFWPAILLPKPNHSDI